jgi:hypothetical protein
MLLARKTHKGLLMAAIAAVGVLAQSDRPLCSATYLDGNGQWRFCSWTITPHTRDIPRHDPVAQSWGPQSDFFVKENFEITSWMAAQQMLLENRASGGKQYHSGWLAISTKDGRIVLTKPLNVNSVFDFARERRLNLDGFAPE